MKTLMRQWTLILALMMIGLSVSAAPYRFEEDTHYVALSVPYETADPDRIEVTEYFSYRCQHCFRFDPVVEQWKSSLPQDVLFNRTPAMWARQDEVLTQTYYALQSIGQLEAVHPAIFEAIHLQGRQFPDPVEMAEYLAELGIDTEAFSKAYKSFGVRSNAQQARARANMYRARAVPAIMVNGKYRISGDLAGSNEAMLEVADFLIERERRARAKTSN